MSFFDFINPKLSQKVVQKKPPPFTIECAVAILDRDTEMFAPECDLVSEEIERLEGEISDATQIEAHYVESLRRQVERLNRVKCGGKFRYLTDSQKALFARWRVRNIGGENVALPALIPFLYPHSSTYITPSPPSWRPPLAGWGFGVPNIFRPHSSYMARTKKFEHFAQGAVSWNDLPRGLNLSFQFRFALDAKARKIVKSADEWGMLVVFYCDYDDVLESAEFKRDPDPIMLGFFDNGDVAYLHSFNHSPAEREIVNNLEPDSSTGRTSG